MDNQQFSVREILTLYYTEFFGMPWSLATATALVNFFDCFYNLKLGGGCLCSQHSDSNKANTFVLFKTILLLELGESLFYFVKVKSFLSYYKSTCYII